MTRKTRKIWAGVGVASLVGATVVTDVGAQHAGSHRAASPSVSTEPSAPAATGMGNPQGGEAYLTDGGPRDTRIRIYRDLALMRGHILVGTELVNAERWDDALPHFLHPAEELYGAMERYIKLHKVTPFDKQLKALAQAVKARNKPAFQQAAKTVDARLTNALNAFQRFMTVQPFSSYTARTVTEMLKVAQAEYEAAIEDGRIAKPVEYQDSRGFVWYAESMIGDQEAEFAKIDPNQFGQIRKQLAELKTIWPSAVPPAQPIATAADLSARVDAIEKLLERFY